MKKLISILILPLFITASLSAQLFDFGVSAGMAPAMDPNTDHIFVNRATPRSEFTFNAIKVSDAPFVGGFVHFKLEKPFYIKAEALYTQYNTDYELRFLGSEFPRSSQTGIFTETIRQIDIPISMGVALGIVEVNSGFTTHLTLSQKSELDIINNYSKDLDFARFGMHTGVAVHFEPVRLEVRYVLDFFTYADHLRVADQNLSLDNTPGRLMATMSYQF